MTHVHTSPPIPDGPFAVKVMPRSKRAGVETDASHRLIVRVHEPPEDGKANDAVIEQLAEYFDVPRRRVAILRGFASRNKLVRISPA